MSPSLSELQIIIRQTQQIIALMAVSPTLSLARNHPNWLEPEFPLEAAIAILGEYDAEITLLTLNQNND